MSCGRICGESRFTLSTKRNNAFSLLVKSRGFQIVENAQTSSSLPSNSAATAACDFSQNGQWFRVDV